MEFVVDSGNSFIKCFVFENNSIIDFECFSHSDEDKVLQMARHYPQITNAIVCDVSQHISLVTALHSQFYTIEFSQSTPIPIANLYETPVTLGLDRIAAAVGAEFILPNTNKLIIDAGTAITIDFVSNHAEFIGGNISAGMETRFKALHTFTGKLPKFESTDEISLTGKNTQQAIQNGVIQGIIFEINGYISTYNTIYSPISVFLTGGDTFFFENKLKKPIFAQPNLNAIGLHRILKYNVEK